MPTADQLVEDAAALFSALDDLEMQTRVETLNRIREALREHSPFKSEPVDCVLWIKSDLVTANDQLMADEALRFRSIPAA